MRFLALLVLLGALGGWSFIWWGRARWPRVLLTCAAKHRRHSGFALTRAAIPRRPDRRPAPARPETAAIVAAADKAGTAEIVQLAVIAEILRRIVRLARDGALPAIHRNGVVRRLVIARQEAVAMP